MERRRAVRQKSFLRGNIQFNNGRNSADCLIRDITTFGARLVCSDSVTTPDVIDVYIPQKEQTFRAHVIWRHGQEMGVAFAQAAASQPPPTIRTISTRGPGRAAGERTRWHEEDAQAAEDRRRPGN